MYICRCIFSVVVFRSIFILSFIFHSFSCLHHGFPPVSDTGRVLFSIPCSMHQREKESDEDGKGGVRGLEKHRAWVLKWSFSPIFRAFSTWTDDFLSYIYDALNELIDFNFRSCHRILSTLVTFFVVDKKHLLYLYSLFPPSHFHASDSAYCGSHVRARTSIDYDVEACSQWIPPRGFYDWL